MKILRLLVTDKCDRQCVGCCNEQYDLDNLPIETNFAQYSEIILTGGEPMLNTTKLTNIIHKIRDHMQIDAKIFVYTAKVDDYFQALKILEMVDGMTVTLHTPEDIYPFRQFSVSIPDYMKNKSLRVNIIKGIEVRKYMNGGLLWGKWQVKKDIEWLENCPLPENEIFKRI